MCVRCSICVSGIVYIWKGGARANCSLHGSGPPAPATQVRRVRSCVTVSPYMCIRCNVYLKGGGHEPIAAFMAAAPPLQQHRWEEWGAVWHLVLSVLYVGLARTMSVYTEYSRCFFAEIPLNIRSYTVYIYGSGQPSVFMVFMAGKLPRIWSCTVCTHTVLADPPYMCVRFCISKRGGTGKSSAC